MDTSLDALKNLVLTQDAKQRIRLAHAGLASALMVLAIVLVHAMVWLGVSPGDGLWPWTAASGLGLVSMFLVIRMGWSASLGDPSLTVPQLLYAVACTAVAYRVVGAAHGVALLMVAVVLMFGMFGLKRAQAWLIGAYSVAAFGLAMASGVRSQPEVYDPRVQCAYFIALMLFVCGLMAVSGRTAAMRRRLRAHKRELAQALEHISKLATYDELTGLLNRRAMTEVLEAERHRSARSGHPWTVAILDVDYFKDVNDAHGHAAGDEALRMVGRVFASELRGCDCAARWGGEEYVLLFRDLDSDRALIAAERIRAGVAATPVRFGDDTFHVTASIGVATYQPNEEVAVTLTRADRALYQAKAAGRNRVHGPVGAGQAVPAG